MSTKIELGTELVCIAYRYLSAPGITEAVCEVKCGMQGIVCGHTDKHIIVSLPIYAISAHVPREDFDKIWVVVP